MWQIGLELWRLSGGLDYEASYLVTGSGMRMRSLEKVLHFLFAEHNVTHEDRKDGHTEWFDIACVDDVLQEIAHIAERKGDAAIAVTQGLPIKHAVPPARHMQEKAASLEQRREASIKANRETLETLKYVFEAMRTLDVKYVHSDDVSNAELCLHGPAESVRLVADGLYNNGKIALCSGGARIFTSYTGTADLKQGVGDVVLTVYEQPYLLDEKLYPEAQELLAYITSMLDDLKQ